jgi:LacI family transcriptional regulator
MAVRLKDIARDLNVSVITVSKAMRGKSDISEAMRERVLARMKELDYQPNMMARSLVTGRSFIVGLIVPDLVNPFFAELAKSVGGALRTESYGLIVASSEDDAGIEQSDIRMMVARGVDALLVASCQTEIVGPTRGLTGGKDQAMPFILLDRPIAGALANFVGTDDFAGGRLATEHLMAVGCKRLSYIGGPQSSPAADRLRGFRAALRDHGMAEREGFVLSNPSVEGAGYSAGHEMMQRLLKRRTRPDGVFCHNDVVAIGAMKATLDAGLMIPRDIAFVGFDNVRYSKYLQIPLTSVDQATGELGAAAARLALDLIANPARKPKTVLLAPSLVVRQSTVGDARLCRQAIGLEPVV